MNLLPDWSWYFVVYALVSGLAAGFFVSAALHLRGVDDDRPH